MPELSKPTNKIGLACCLNAAQCALRSKKGNITAAAIPTRMAAVGKTPNSAEAIRVNKKDAPQMAAKAKNSINIDFFMSANHGI
jgi:hypothetical protein